MNPLQSIIRSQRRLSAAFDRLLPAAFLADGNHDFRTNFAPSYLTPGITVFDVGGGKSPYVSAELKAKLKLRIIGIDISQDELNSAPPDTYDEVICTDISQFRGAGDADLVICQTLLEHVRDVRQAVAAISTILKPGGHFVLFVPSRKAIFAKINLVLPERVKRYFLHSIFPESQEKQGFPAYYDHCSPSEFNAILTGSGFVVEAEKLYFSSGYFSFFFPAHAIWRLWLLIYRSAAGDEAAETFSIAARKL